MALCAKCGKESNNLRVCPFCHTEYVQTVAGRASTSMSAPRQSVAAPRQTGTMPRQTGAMPRQTGAMPRQTGAMGTAGRATVQTLAVKPKRKVSLPTILSLSGLVAAFLVWYFVIAADTSVPVGVVVPNFVAAPMGPGEAEATIRRTKETGKVETRGTGIVVTFPAASWPQRRVGQMALAQQFARADEIVEGKKRNIEFIDPEGHVYAKADASGVVMVR